VACVALLILLIPVTRHEAIYLDAQGCLAYRSLKGQDTQAQAVGCRLSGMIKHEFNAITIDGITIKKEHVIARSLLETDEPAKRSVWEQLAVFYIGLAVLVAMGGLWIWHLYRKSKRRKGAA
jgi:hypothetical protein